MKYNNNIPQVKNIGLQHNFHRTNQFGLAMAYASDKSTHIDGDTMYIAGTKTAKDWYDNFIELFFNLTNNADRYKDAENIKGKSTGYKYCCSFSWFKCCG